MDDLSDLANSINNIGREMDESRLASIIEAAVTAALAAQRAEFEYKLNQVAAQPPPQMVVPVVKQYEPVSINHNIRCDETLDVVKCIPEFNGNRDNYVSWRQAAFNAHKVYELYEGSSKYYQAVAIIRNKIRGTADATLTSFNTVLNFEAIIARLDFAYGDKRPIHLIEQEMAILRQGNLSVRDFYDEVEKRLTDITNKTIMTYSDIQLVNSLNDKYRADALRVFISGLKKSLSNTIFAARPTNLPAALALAEELESNRDRYLFASNFAQVKSESTISDSSGRKPLPPRISDNNHNRSNARSSVNNKVQQSESVEPMEVDPSTSGLRRQLGMNSMNRKASSSTRASADKQRQHINHAAVEETKEEDDYQKTAESAVDSADESDDDVINFLE